MTNKTDFPVDQPTTSDGQRIPYLWNLVYKEIQDLTTHGRKANRWRTAHAHTTGHATMARSMAKTEIEHRLNNLRDLILTQAPPSWNLSNWGFALSSNLRDARWDQHNGKGKESWANYIAVNNSINVASFLGRIFAAFDIALQASTPNQPQTLFRFAIPHTKAFWWFPPRSILGHGANDAFAKGAFLGIFTKPTRQNHPQKAFTQAYHHTIKQHRISVPSRVPELIKRILDNPTAKHLMAAQTHINDSHTLGTFRKVVSQRNTVGFNTQLTTRTQTITEVHKMETLLEETLLVLHNLKKPRSKTVWQNWQCNKPRFKNVQAWNTESAATIASIDDLQMIARALPPSAYTPFFQPHP